MTPLERLQFWVANQCDGDWEHGTGVRIETLDNPGWMVTIDLSATPLADVGFPRVIQQRSEIDWVQIEVSGGSFIGCGGSGNLTELIERFLDLVGV